MVSSFEGGGRYKPLKIFIHNTTLFHSLQLLVGTGLDKGNLRELFLQALRDANQTTFYSKQGDYRVGNHIFEIGGKNKTGKQLQDSDLPGFLVKDDILSPGRNVIHFILFWVPILGTRLDQ